MSLSTEGMKRAFLERTYQLNETTGLDGNRNECATSLKYSTNSTSMLSVIRRRTNPNGYLRIMYYYASRAMSECKIKRMNQFLLSPDIFRNLYSNIRASVKK